MQAVIHKLLSDLVDNTVVVAIVVVVIVVVVIVVVAVVVVVYIAIVVVIAFKQLLWDFIDHLKIESLEGF
jgi:hypothetical protein